jgi:hydrogenase maturation protease
MKRPLVIGYGNRLRQDDGLGWRAAELLERAIHPGAVRILESFQLTPELAADLEGASVVIFLDAALDLEPGMVVTKRISPENQMVWSHDLSCAQLTAFTEALTGTERPVFQITGGVYQAGFGENLTPCGEQSAMRMAEAAVELLREYTNRSASPDCSSASV